MVRVVAATKGNDLNREIGNLVVQATAYLAADDFTIRRIKADTQKLAQVNALEASLCYSNLAMATGDLQESQRWSTNVRKLGASAEASACEFIAFSNLGYFSRAAEPYREIVDFRNGIASNHLFQGMICASFRDLIESAAECKRANIELGEIDRKAVGAAMMADVVLSRLGVTEADVQAMLDVAGEVMREQRLFWLESLPRVHVLDSADGACLLYQFQLGVDSKVANDLSDEVLVRMVERDLDKPGLTFSFLSA